MYHKDNKIEYVTLGLIKRKPDLRHVIIHVENRQNGWIIPLERNNLHKNNNQNKQRESRSDILYSKPLESSQISSSEICIIFGEIIRIHSTTIVVGD
jgi:hypothetical protein